MSTPSFRLTGTNESGTNASPITYPALFTAAFGSPKITAEKISLALEQFVLTLTSFDSKFAVPSLRNVAATAPYMHDGRFATLEQVIEHYSTGVKRSATLDPNLAKHPEGGLNLSAADKAALVAFLKSLTDERYLNASIDVK